MFLVSRVLRHLQALFYNGFFRKYFSNFASWSEVRIGRILLQVQNYNTLFSNIAGHDQHVGAGFLHLYSNRLLCLSAQFHHHTYKSLHHHQSRQSNSVWSLLYLNVSAFLKTTSVCHSGVALFMCVAMRKGHVKLASTFVLLVVSSRCPCQTNLGPSFYSSIRNTHSEYLQLTCGSGFILWPILFMTLSVAVTTTPEGLRVANCRLNYNPLL